MSAGVWAAVGGLGAVGALVRFAAAQIAGPARAHLGTLTINLVGSFVLGLIVGLGSSESAVLVVGGGLLGATTTFSTWILESHSLARVGRPRHAAANLVGPLAAGFVLALLGWWLGGRIT